jgi:hypothetical protein
MLKHIWNKYIRQWSLKLLSRGIEMCLMPLWHFATETGLFTLAHIQCACRSQCNGYVYSRATQCSFSQLKLHEMRTHSCLPSLCHTESSLSSEDHLIDKNHGHAIWATNKCRQTFLTMAYDQNAYVPHVFAMQAKMLLSSSSYDQFKNTVCVYWYTTIRMQLHAMIGTGTFPSHTNTSHSSATNRICKQPAPESIFLYLYIDLSMKQHYTYSMLLPLRNKAEYDTW